MAQSTSRAARHYMDAGLGADGGLYTAPEMPIPVKVTMEAEEVDPIAANGFLVKMLNNVPDVVPADAVIVVAKSPVGAGYAGLYVVSARCVNPGEVLVLLHNFDAAPWAVGDVDFEVNIIKTTPYVVPE